METFLNIYPLMALGYTGYFIISYIYNIIKIDSLVDTLTSSKALKLINIKHISGIILFGAGFLFFFSDFQFLLINSGFDDFAGNIILLNLIFISGFFSKKSASKYFRELKNLSVVTPREQILYFSIRIPFLFLYELFFRGMLLHSTLIFTNLFGAIFINLALYTLIHSFNSKKEIIGCIPFGIVLCLSSYYTSSIWPAFLIHATLSFMYESTLFKITSLKTQKS